jgi:hypothetical protein
MSPSKPPAIMPNIMPNEDDILLGLPWDTLIHNHPRNLFLRESLSSQYYLSQGTDEAARAFVAQVRECRGMFPQNRASKKQPYTWKEEESGDAVDYVKLILIRYKRKSAASARAVSAKHTTRFSRS